MASSYGIKKITFIAFISFLLFSLKSEIKSTSSEKLIDKNTQYVFLEDGDLVCRLGKGYFSNYFKEYASKDKEYSHIGIIIFEKNLPYVIHSEASELTGVGGIKKEKLSDFLNDIDKFSFFRLKINQSEKQNLISKSKYFLNKHVKFDLNFDSMDDKEMYCTEFVAKCINYATENETIKPKIKLNNKLYYGLDDIYKNDKAMKLNY